MSSKVHLTLMLFSIAVLLHQSSPSYTVQRQANDILITGDLNCDKYNALGYFKDSTVGCKCSNGAAGYYAVYHALFKDRLPYCFSSSQFGCFLTLAGQNSGVVSSNQNYVVDFAHGPSFNEMSGYRPQIWNMDANKDGFWSDVNHTVFDKYFELRKVNNNDTLVVKDLQNVWNGHAIRIIIEYNIPNFKDQCLFIKVQGSITYPAVIADIPATKASDVFVLPNASIHPEFTTLTKSYTLNKETSVTSLPPVSSLAPSIVPMVTSIQYGIQSRIASVEDKTTISIIQHIGKSSAEAKLVSSQGQGSYQSMTSSTLSLLNIQSSTTTLPLLNIPSSVVSELELATKPVATLFMSTSASANPTIHSSAVLAYTTESPPKDKGNQAPMIAGIVVGSVSLLGFLLVVFFVARKKLQRIGGRVQPEDDELALRIDIPSRTESLSSAEDAVKTTSNNDHNGGGDKSNTTNDKTF